MTSHGNLDPMEKLWNAKIAQYLAHSICSNNLVPATVSIPDNLEQPAIYPLFPTSCYVLHPCSLSRHRHCPHRHPYREKNAYVHTSGISLSGSTIHRSGNDLNRQWPRTVATRGVRRPRRSGRAQYRCYCGMPFPQIHRTSFCSKIKVPLCHPGSWPPYARPSSPKCVWCDILRESLF